MRLDLTISSVGDSGGAVNPVRAGPREWRRDRVSGFSTDLRAGLSVTENQHSGVTRHLDNECEWRPSDAWQAATQSASRRAAQDGVAGSSRVGDHDGPVSDLDGLCFSARSYRLLARPTHLKSGPGDLAETSKSNQSQIGQASTRP